MIQYSRLYTGWVRHRRFLPHEHSFNYKVFMLYLDLDEIDDVFAVSRLWSIQSRNWQSFYREDYFKGRKVDLKESIIDHIETNSEIKGTQIHRICMLTNLRTLGFTMNPVTFYYAFDKDDKLLVIMPEITNTPWKERDQYLLSTSAEAVNGMVTPFNRQAKKYRYKLSKKFHVSPFNPLDMKYDWRFTVPGDYTQNVHLVNYKNNEKIFDATMILEPTMICAKNIRRTLIQFPAITVKVAAGIYYNALILWIKRNPFYPHPNKSTHKGT